MLVTNGSFKTPWGRFLQKKICYLNITPYAPTEILLLSVVNHFYFAIQLIIEAVRSQNYRGDIAIDEIGFNKGLCGKERRSGPDTRAS